MYSFIVYGQPIPQGRPRFVRVGRFVRTYDPKKSVDFKELVAATAAAVGVQVMTGPVEISIRCYFERPKVMMGRQFSDDALAHWKRSDLDNVVKGVSDALNGIAYKDDSQIWKISAYKFYREKFGYARTEIEISQ